MTSVHDALHRNKLSSTKLITAVALSGQSTQMALLCTHLTVPHHSLDETCISLSYKINTMV